MSLRYSGGVSRLVVVPVVLLAPRIGWIVGARRVPWRGWAWRARWDSRAPLRLGVVEGEMDGLGLLHFRRVYHSAVWAQWGWRAAEISEWKLVSRKAKFVLEELNNSGGKLFFNFSLMFQFSERVLPCWLIILGGSGFRYWSFRLSEAR